MSWNGKKGMKLSGGLDNAIFHPRVHIYPANGSGRDVHCFMHPRTIDTMPESIDKFNTSTAKTGRKSSQITIP